MIITTTTKGTAMKMTATLYNDFHNTEVRVRVPEDGKLSARQGQRLRRVLCGHDECLCGKIRGPQEYMVEEYYDYYHQGVLYKISEPPTDNRKYETITLYVTRGGE